MSEPYKKTGATPIAEEESDGAGLVSAGTVLGVTELRVAIVKLRDGHGQQMVKIALAIPGGEVYFLDERAVNMKPAQQWARTQVHKMLGTAG